MKYSSHLWSPPAIAFSPAIEWIMFTDRIIYSDANVREELR